MTVHVTPRAGRDDLMVSEGVLRVRLKAAPVDGAANDALIALLAERLHVSKTAVTITRGGSSRNKLITVADLSPDTLWRRLTTRSE